MNGAPKQEVGLATYELAIEIDASPHRAWKALVEETNALWLPDFHMVGSGSTVTWTFAQAAGSSRRLRTGAVSFGYTVHWFRPQERTIHLVGHVAPDWGGPTTTHLTLAVKARGNGSVLEVRDALYGQPTSAKAPARAFMDPASANFRCDQQPREERNKTAANGRLAGERPEVASSPVIRVGIGSQTSSVCK